MIGQHSRILSLVFRKDGLKSRGKLRNKPKTLHILNAVSRRVTQSSSTSSSPSGSMTTSRSKSSLLIAWGRSVLGGYHIQVGNKALSRRDYFCGNSSSASQELWDGSSKLLQQYLSNVWTGEFTHSEPCERGRVSLRNKEPTHQVAFPFWSSCATALETRLHLLHRSQQAYVLYGKVSMQADGKSFV